MNRVEKYLEDNKDLLSDLLIGFENSKPALTFQDHLYFVKLGVAGRFNKAVGDLPEEERKNWADVPEILALSDILDAIDKVFPEEEA